MGITERKERDRLEMRRMILEHAMRLFLKEGFENVTIRRIAESIEYSPATVYLYFADKDAILFALHSEGFQKLIALQRTALLVENPLERLTKAGEVYLRFALENPEYYDLMFIMSATGKAIGELKEDWSVGVESYDILRTNVRECLAAGVIPPGDVEAISFALWSLVHGMAALIIRQRCVMIPEESLPALVRGGIEYIMGSLRIG